MPLASPATTTEILALHFWSRPKHVKNLSCLAYSSYCLHLTHPRALWSFPTPEKDLWTIGGCTLVLKEMLMKGNTHDRGDRRHSASIYLSSVAGLAISIIHQVYV
jgi:hypothetical protein